MIILKVLFIYAISFAFYFFFGCLALGFSLSLEGIYRYRLFIFEQFEKNSVVFVAIFTLTPLILSLIFYFIFVFQSDNRYQNLYRSLSQEIKKLKANSEDEKLNHKISLEKFKHENDLLKKQIPTQKVIKEEFENLSNELSEVKEIITDLQEVTINYQEENESKKERLIQAIAKKKETGSKKNKPLRFQPLNHNT
jgi:isochorismate hydrolase